MLGGRLPSMTAMIVACARGARGGPDDVSHRFVPQAIARPLLAAMKRGSFGLVPHVSLRTLAIDRVVRADVERGVRQVVVLGAGLDARPYRMPELAQSVVFEVDHP